MNSPQLSVILPSYNYAKYLPEALGSLAGQEFVDWELVAFDDGSKDGSPDILRAFAQKHPDKVRVFEHSQGRNRGLSETLREALSHCRGQVVAFLEADDIWMPQALARAMTVFNDHPEVAVVHGAPAMFGEPALVRRRFSDYRWLSFPSKETSGRPYEALPFLLRSNISRTLSSVAVRKNALEGLDWDAPHPAWLDWWLMAQVAVRGRFYFEPRPTVRWRIHAESYNARYRSTIDEKKEAFAFAAGIRRLAERTFKKSAEELGADRRQVLVRVLERSRRMAPFLPVWASFKKIVPDPWKSAAKNILFRFQPKAML